MVDKSELAQQDMQQAWAEAMRTYTSVQSAIYVHLAEQRAIRVIK